MKVKNSENGFFNFESGAFNHSATLPKRAYLFLTNPDPGQTHSPGDKAI
jgi:hypothetical protein